MEQNINIKEIKEIKLYPHNQVTYEKINEAWKTSNRVAVIQATGTGKSYLILKCLEDVVNERKVVLAPSNYILDQLVQESGYEVIPNAELLTYQKLSFMTSDEIEKLNPTLIVLDEFHRCGAETWGNGVQKLLELFPNAKILGTTATPVRFLDNERDMADELFDGNIVNNLGLAEAIAKEILPMPKYVSALYTLDNEITNLRNKVDNSKNSEESKEELMKEIDKLKNHLEKSKGISNIFKKYIPQNSNDKFIVFCKDINHLNEMKKVVTDWFKKSKVTKNIDTYVAYTGYSNTKNEIQDFTNNKSLNTVKLLFSVEMLNEGIHIEDVTGVILLRPTISPIIFYQQIGRSIQAGNHNNPLVFDFVNNFNNIGAKNFKNDLKEFIRREKENNEDCDNDRLDYLDSLEFMIFDEIQDVENVFGKIENELIDNWDAMYEELVKYKNQYKHCNVHQEFEQNNLKLGIWVDYQRIRMRKNVMSADRITKLNEIGFNWNPRDDKWNNMYDKLVVFKNKNGYCNVRIDDKENKALYIWIARQKGRYNKKIIEVEKQEKLEKLGLIWNENVERWEIMFNELIKYKNEYGNCKVPIRLKYHGLNLGVWVSEQRKKYKNNTIESDKINSLENIGFIWNINHTS